MTDQFWWGVLVGWTCGAAFITLIFWRRLSGWHAKEARRLRVQLEDADAQITGLHGTADRMARMLAEQAGRERRP